MANFTININSRKLDVTKDIIVTDCSTIFKYTIQANDTNSIKITLTGDHKNEFIIDNGVTSTFTNTITVSFDTTLELRFILENSGNPGYFDTTDVLIENLTDVIDYTETVTREDDNPRCINANAAEFDDLEDTPDSKIGQAGKFVKVSDDETVLEYTDLTLPTGTVESVTGDGVDNTDSDNPVLTFPTPDDIGALETADIADFETSTELDVRDTNNRNRTNHTGTQLASTISDFNTKAIEAVIVNIAVAGSFTVLPTHHGATIELSGTTPTITFDPDTYTYPDNFSVYFHKLDSTDATITFAAATGWTYREGAATPVASGSFTLAGKSGMCGVIRNGSDNLLKLLGNA